RCTQRPSKAIWWIPYVPLQPLPRPYNFFAWPLFPPSGLPGLLSIDQRQNMAANYTKSFYNNLTINIIAPGVSKVGASAQIAYHPTLVFLNPTGFPCCLPSNNALPPNFPPNPPRLPPPSPCSTRARPCPSSRATARKPPAGWTTSSCACWRNACVTCAN